MLGKMKGLGEATRLALCSACPDNRTHLTLSQRVGTLSKGVISYKPALPQVLHCGQRETKLLALFI